jgi:hypothetical protein
MRVMAGHGPICETPPWKWLRAVGKAVRKNMAPGRDPGLGAGYLPGACSNYEDPWPRSAASLEEALEGTRLNGIDRRWAEAGASGKLGEASDKSWDGKCGKPLRARQPVMLCLVARQGLADEAPAQEPIPWDMSSKPAKSEMIGRRFPMPAWSSLPKRRLLWIRWEGFAKHVCRPIARAGRWGVPGPGFLLAGTRGEGLGSVEDKAAAGKWGRVLLKTALHGNAQGNPPFRPAGPGSGTARGAALIRELNGKGGANEENLLLYRLGTPRFRVQSQRGRFLRA